VNTPTALAPSERAPLLKALIANNPHVRLFYTLARREFWEHRSLWIAPAVVMALLLLCALLTHGALQIDASDTSEWLDPQVKTIVFALAQWGLTIPHYLVMILVLNFYLLDCLYAERKDRSILFWKSLPVGDGVTVASKLLVGCVIVPFGTYAIALVTDLLFTAIWDVRAVLGHAPELVLWDTTAFLKTQILMFLGLVISILWYAPFCGVFVLASAVVRRNVLMWVTVVPLLVIIFERIAFGTHYFAHLLSYRGDGIWGDEHLNLQAAVIGSLVGVGRAAIASIPAIYDRVHVAGVFLNIDLWLGVLFALACAYAAARIRRFRDDT
jgi:ABC-2 type transport system permease protein